jgi:oxygen-dependent protoporphyrinogen oxidase
MPHVVVIGGGIAGLAAAHSLRDFDVTMIEGSTHIGGKLRTTAIAGVEVDEGAEAFLARIPEALDLARSVGLAQELVHPATTSASVLARGRLRPLPSRTLFGVPASVRSLRGVLTARQTARAAADLLLPAQNHDTNDESVGALVGRRLGRAAVDWLVDPLLGGVYAGRADELSVRATVPQLASAGGSLVRAARRAVPVPSAHPAPVFATVRGGLGAFAAAVARASNVHVVTGRLVRRIERTPAGFRVVHGPTTDERALDADAVIIAVPAAPAARLLGEIAPAAAAELAGIDAASMAIVTTAWRPTDLVRASGSGYLIPAVTGRPVKAVTFASTKWEHLRRPDVAVVRSSIGRHGDHGDLQRDDEELVEMAVAELQHTIGAAGRPIEARVTRWGGGLPQYAVGHVERVRRIRAAVAAVPGLGVCGASYDGVGIPACIRTAWLAADEVRLTLPG